VELGLAWRNFAGGTGAAITTWNYDPHRGFLTSKLDANGYGPTYTYTAAGRLLTRTWARTPAITTTYGYNNLGEVVLVDYSDLTPDVSFVFDRRGRQTQVTCNGIVTSLGYHNAGHLLSESYSGGTLGTFSVTNTLDSLLRK
jgi:YD repeat-containing protein